MAFLSENAERTLRRLMGRDGNEPQTSVSQLPRSAGPTLVKIEDPREDVEEVLRRLDEPTTGRPPNRWLAKNRSAGSGITRERVPVFEGRRCCMELVESLDRRLGSLRLPYRTTCPGCGTVYEVRNMVREERPPHGSF